jgi:RNA polymerase sigma-70 factor (ECF subfamily)
VSSDDKQLITRFLEGESEAMKIIDSWIARAAWPFQRRLASEWEDVLQDIRLEVARLLRRGEFRGEASLKTYLWRVAGNACINQIRAQSKRDWVNLEDVAERSLPDESMPANQLLKKESGEMLLRVLEKMPEECRQMWGMILAGLSYQEMSRQLGVSEGTLRVRVLRCRKRAVSVRDELMGSKQKASL